MILAAQVWHFWIGVALAVGAILTVLALAIGYVKSVEMPRYPNRGQEVAAPKTPAKR